MTKYYRVRSQEQCDWLKNKLEIEDGLHVSNFPVTILYGDVICGIYRYHDDPEPLIEVSKLMEDEKMENKNIANSTESSMPTSNKKIKDDGYVTISYSDLEKIKTSSGDNAFEWVEMEDESTKYGLKHVVDEIHIPKSLVQQKIKMTEAEKAEFDKLNKEWTTLYLAINAINDEFLEYPLLLNRLFRRMTSAEDNEAQLEFARAWADPSLIEVIPEKRWNVKIPPFSRTNQFYYKYGKHLSSVHGNHNDDEDQQFTESELKEYGLDDDMYEKEEVTDDGTK